jgi:hypothetical protein
MAPAYDWREVPETGDDRSRFLLAVTPAGQNSTPADTLALVANAAAAQLVKDAPYRAPESKTLALSRVAVTDEGEYVLVARGSVTAPITREPVSRGKFIKKTLEAGPLVDSILLGETGYRDYRDEDCWEALRAVCERERITGRTLRRLNDEMCRILLVRAGIEPCHPDKLPN